MCQRFTLLLCCTPVLLFYHISGMRWRDGMGPIVYLEALVQIWQSCGCYEPAHSCRLLGLELHVLHLSLLALTSTAVGREFKGRANLGELPDKSLSFGFCTDRCDVRSTASRIRYDVGLSSLFCW